MINPMQKFTAANCLDFMRQKRLHEDTGKNCFAQADFLYKNNARARISLALFIEFYNLWLGHFRKAQ
jgi:hypothetical protein